MLTMTIPVYVADGGEAMQVDLPPEEEPIQVDSPEDKMEAINVDPPAGLFL